MHKIKTIASIFVIALVVASILLAGHLSGLENNGSPIDDASFEEQQPDESPVYNESLDEQLSGVKIASFEVAGWYTGPVFPKIGYQYNLTIRNYENTRIEGMVISIKTFDNNSSPVDVQFYGTEQPVNFDGILEANETRTVPGTISSTLTESMTSLVKTVVVQIKLGNDTLDELQTNLY